MDIDRNAGRVRVARAYLRWSQHRLASEAGLPFWTLSAFERGERKMTVEEMEKIAIVLVREIGGAKRDFFPASPLFFVATDVH